MKEEDGRLRRDAAAAAAAAADPDYDPLSAHRRGNVSAGVVWLTPWGSGWSGVAVGCPNLGGSSSGCIQADFGCIQAD